MYYSITYAMRRFRKSYNNQELYLLHKLREEGMGYGDIANILNRTTKAIEQKYVKSRNKGFNSQHYAKVLHMAGYKRLPHSRGGVFVAASESENGSDVVEVNAVEEKSTRDPHAIWPQIRDIDFNGKVIVLNTATIHRLKEAVRYIDRDGSVRQKRLIREFLTLGLKDNAEVGNTLLEEYKSAHADLQKSYEAKTDEYDKLQEECVKLKRVVANCEKSTDGTGDIVNEAGLELLNMYRKEVAGMRKHIIYLTRNG